MLIGAELFFNLLCIGQIKPHKDAPIFQKTLLGWIASGRTVTDQPHQETSACHMSVENDQEQLKQFWEIEECEAITNKPITEDEICESHYISTTSRDTTGRYKVELPIKVNISELGDSKTTASFSFLQVERKLAQNPSLHNNYSEFMAEYDSHMGVVSETSNCNDMKRSYHIPHLPVIREESTANNPADPISRDLRPCQVINCQLRRKGPQWLGHPQELWPDRETIEETPETPERRWLKNSLTSIETQPLVDPEEKVKRVAAFVLRFIYNLKNKEHQHKITEESAAHFGGLWEAGIKSVKHPLMIVIGIASLTYEALYTTLTMIEACLNSRPLTPLYNNPNDSLPLTPGHFLTGNALTAIPEPSLETLPEGRLSMWQRSQQLTQHFWSRWSKEYLASLQQRTKWRADTSNIQPGQLVIVKDDNLPPLRWITARVVEVHPGADNKIRVATIKTTTGTYRRATNKLCVLPLE